MAMIIPDPGDDAVDAASFVARAEGCIDASISERLHGALAASGKSVGGGCAGGADGSALKAGKTYENWCLDSGASGHMSPDSTGMTNFRQCDKVLVVANAARLPIEGHGNLVVEFDNGWKKIHVELIDVAYIPLLSYHRFFLRSAVKRGHTYLGDSRGITLKLKPGKTFLVPEIGNLYWSRGLRTKDPPQQACVAVLIPGAMPTTGVDINAYHRSPAHTHPVLPRKSAEQQGMQLKKDRELVSCVGCSAARGYRAPVNKTTACRSDKKLGRILIDLIGKKSVKSIGGNCFAMILRDDISRYSWE